jgi:secreted Zn-dependent insulinase-like peptidase
MIKEPSYNFLRTKNQLGYIAGGATYFDNMRYYLRIYVQADKNNKTVLDIMNEFVNNIFI